MNDGSATATGANRLALGLVEIPSLGLTAVIADRVMKATDAVGFVGATSLERMGIEASLTNLTKEFKSLKAPAAKKFGKKVK